MSSNEKLTVLIIEDEPDTLYFFSRAIERAGMNVFIARDRDSGISKAKEVVPDIIILDLKLPPGGTAEEGFRVFEELNKDPSMKNAAFIIVTAYVSEENQERARKLNLTNYYEKPMTDDELIKAVMDAVPIKDIDPRLKRKRADEVNNSRKSD